MTTLNASGHHAKKRPVHAKRTISEKRRRPARGVASATRATRRGNTRRPGRRP